MLLTRQGREEKMGEEADITHPSLGEDSGY